MISLSLIIVIMTGLVSFQAFKDTAMKHKLWFHPVSINRSGEFYRFLTHGFIHADMNHLLINMFVLWQFGETVERVFTSTSLFGPVMGRVYFIVLYISAIILSSVASFFKHKDNNYYAAVGASGATSALVFASIIFDPWRWFLFPPLPGAVLAVAYLFYSSYMSKKGTDNIGHDAHFWGAVYGLLFTVAMIYFYNPFLLERLFDLLLSGQSASDFFK